MKKAAKSFKTTNIRGKNYVEVKERLLYLSNDFDGEYSIDTNYEYFPERRMWVVKAMLTIKQGESVNTYTGLAQEIESDNGKDVNATSALENCETSAVGRACAMAGIGIETSIASADEVNKALNREPQPAKVEGTSQPAREAAAQDEELNKLRDTYRRGINHELITDAERKASLLKLNTYTKEELKEKITALAQTIKKRENKQG